MAFLTLRDVNLRLNNRNILCNSISLDQSADISQSFEESEIVSVKNAASSPIQNQLSINYSITGIDYLKEFIFTNHKQKITGNLCGLIFNNGYLESYSLNASPNSPLNISANIKICDEISGSFSAASQLPLPINKPVWHFDDAYFNNYSYSANTIDNIINYSWNYRTEITPIYYQRDSGVNFINPDIVSFGPKQISCDIICDSESLPLPYSGEQISLELVCRNSSLSQSQTYPVSGKISRKNFSVKANDTSRTIFSINQSHVNNYPKIESVITSNYPSSNYILIYSPDNNRVNGFISENNGFSLVEKVRLGDRDLNFTTAYDGTRDIITAILPNDIINGYLQVSTTKGLLNYGTPILLNYNPITISGFSPDTGNYYDSIIISGSNFNRIDKVLFGNLPASFYVYNTTGNPNQILVTIPDRVNISKISVISSLRNLSGISSDVFYVRPQITGFTPTGTWSGDCQILGNNFSGITNVYFNNIRSHSFVTNNNYSLTAKIPGTGAGYTKGYIKISGYKGMTAISDTKYQPIVKITGVSLLSGGAEDDIAISGIFDPDFLYQSGAGYGVAFGNRISFFYRSGTYTLTGLIPADAFGVAQPAMVEPDGATRYTPFTGNFIQVAPPIANTVNNQTWFLAKRFKFYDLSFQGENLNYFFGRPHFLFISGKSPGRNLNERYYFNNVIHNAAGTQMIASGIRVTGYGDYSIFPVNYAGTGERMPGGIWNNNDMDTYESTATLSQSTTQTSAVLNTPPLPAIAFGGPAIWAVDANNYSYSSTFPFGHIPGDTPYTSGFLDIILANPTDIGAIGFYGNSVSQLTNASTAGNFEFYEGQNIFSFSEPYYRANTGLLQIFDRNLTTMLHSGISFDDGYVTLPRLTGVKVVRFYRNEGESRFLAFAGIQVI